MGKHEEIATNRKMASYVTAGVALELAALFGFTYAIDTSAPIVRMLATSIFIDGTKDIIPTGDNQAADRMRDTLSGAYDQCSVPSCANNVYIDYSRDFGILTGGVGYDDSKAEATSKTIQAIRDAQDQNPGDPIYVVGYSQGANASSDVIKQIEQNNASLDPSDPDYVDLSNVTFVMVGNGARNDGGLWARLPAGVYVPFLGLSFGASTNPITPSEDPNAPQVILVTKQYDGAGDVPKYMLLNPIADINAALGFLYVHNGYYQDVDISDLDKDDDGKLSEEEIEYAPDKYIITQNGNVVDVLIKNEPGQLPITQPLRDLGVPDSVILALDPILRSMIEAGYERQPDGGVYPAEPVHIGLIPDPGKLLSDFSAIAAAFEQTGENLDPLNSASIAPTSVGVGSSLVASKQLDPAPPIAPAPPTPTAKKGAPVLPFAAPQWTPPRWAPPVTTKLAPPPPPAEEEFVPPAEEDPIIIEKANSSGGPQTNVVRGPIGGSPTLPGLKKITTAINGVVTGIQNALTPKPTGTSDLAPASDPPPDPPSDPPPSDPPPSDPAPSESGT